MRLCVGWVLGVALAACAKPPDPAVRLAAECADMGRPSAQRVGACTMLLAIPELDAAIRTEALAHRGAAYAKTREPTSALADFNAALAADPEFKPAKLGRAAILIESGQLDAAAVLLESVIASGEHAALAHRLRGDLNARWGAPDAAIADYDAALSLDPALAAALANRGAVKQGLGALADARADFDAALALAPNQTAARAGRCWNRLRQNEDAAAAQRDGHIAARGDPVLVSAHLCLGMALLKQHEWVRARAAYESVLALEPANAEALYGRGLAALRAGDRRAGNADIDRAQQFNSRVEDGFRRLGVRL